MKKIVALIVVIFIVLAAATAKYKNTSSKYKDINFVAQKYISSGLFNSYKLYRINSMSVSFSDGTIAVVSVDGLQDKAPHKDVNYKIFLEKTKNGIWKVRKIYSE